MGRNRRYYRVTPKGNEALEEYRVEWQAHKEKVDSILMLDQPTNHLDLESITAVNNGLINFPGNVIFTSQDHQFISTVADRIIEIRQDGTIADYLCNYEEYLEKTRDK